ncbi:exonuclease SbcCD subunit D C-terminal domain-containing protein [Desulfobotulus mexicanus]|uniref:Nuclease SbcCD subunit D n=1 Tax=Desulfobotulus mexicanus TaxID=2586642 RepID=A0A5S5MDR7_9BACT|nr:exonuclease SbcCD subunit D C-terminal domain-containing protein [Desulfobotulus mexicanus]TYT73852.1 exonuclease subunit SbcD [Desulfobotulus mexicanus]
MKFLHTSDWHLGRTLYNQQRYEEFEAFLLWLGNLIRAEAVDILLVSGDVFDTRTPSHRAQTLYYRFLCQMAEGACRHVVVTGGNHDSPSFLNAPREILRSLKVHVLGEITGDPEDEILILNTEKKDDENGKKASPDTAILCAVPFLKDRDVRVSEAGESADDKQASLIEGIRKHYADVSAMAEKKRSLLSAETNRPETDFPIIVMGHLFAAGGKSVEGDGVRDLYVGSLAHVSADIFPESADYVALGHLHSAQKVGGSDFVRYSGSPLAMGFGETRREKSVSLVTFGDSGPALSLIPVPVFQKLERIQGNWDEISGRIAELSLDASDAWLEILYTGKDVMGDLRQALDEAVKGSAMTILCVKNRQIADRILEKGEVDETLFDLNVKEVFDRCLEAHGIPEDQRVDLQQSFAEIVFDLTEEGRTV